jgi:mono/diheme cytochrome c family protein
MMSLKPRSIVPIVVLAVCLPWHASSAASPATAASTAGAAAPAVAHGATAADVARGKYLALAADCASCHTAAQGQPYAGGVPLKSAFGTLYGSNITPDPKTGIGTWTRDDFARALHLGVRKDGAYLYPAMPYNSYTKLTDADVNALWAYLKTIKPVESTPPANTLPFPLTIRSGMAVWQELYFKPGRYQPVKTKGSDWNHGAYLVQALGHCSECHTPRDAAQGLESKHLLTGAQIEGWYAPDISNDPLSALGKWNTQQLAAFLKSGKTPNNETAVGPMQEVVHDSLSKLPDADLTAMAIYLKDQNTQVSAQAATPAKLPPERLANGRRVYEDNCTSCHQSNGKGITGSVPALAGNESVAASEPYNIVMAVLQGFPAHGTYGAMNSFANALDDDQIADLANYVRTAWGNQAIPNATPWSVANWRRNATTANEAPAMLCPSLSTDVLKPALDEGNAAIKRAQTDRGQMNKLVSDYRRARPQTSAGEAIEALSTAYCRALATDQLPPARMDAQIAEFAQRVAVAMSNRPPQG